MSMQTVSTIHASSHSADETIIPDDTIELLTGYKTPSKQCKILREAGIFFIIRRDGRPRTTWAHFNNPLSHRQRMQDTNPTPEPDFGALD